MAIIDVLADAGRGFDKAAPHLYEAVESKKQRQFEAVSMERRIAAQNARDELWRKHSTQQQQTAIDARTEASALDHTRQVEEQKRREGVAQNVRDQTIALEKSIRDADAKHRSEVEKRKADLEERRVSLSEADYNRKVLKDVQETQKTYVDDLLDAAKQELGNQGGGASQGLGQVAGDTRHFMNGFDKFMNEQGKLSYESEFYVPPAGDASGYLDRDAALKSYKEIYQKTQAGANSIFGNDAVRQEVVQKNPRLKAILDKIDAELGITYTTEPPVQQQQTGPNFEDAFLRMPGMGSSVAP